MSGGIHSPRTVWPLSIVCTYMLWPMKISCTVLQLNTHTCLIVCLFFLPTCMSDSASISASVVLIAFANINNSMKVFA
jgi:hypothetical protein